MNELLIIGTIAAAMVLVCAASAAVENRRAIGEWLFDVVTQYYMFKARRARKKARMR